MRPGGVVEIHKEALQKKALDERLEKAGAYSEERRFPLTGIMGNMLSFYRNHYPAFFGPGMKNEDPE